MKTPVIAAALLLCATAAGAAELPDLGGRTVVAVTENAYVPLNFADPATGEGIGWEYDAFNEIAARLNLTVEWNLSSWDTMIQAVREGQFEVGMDGITITEERREQVLDFEARVVAVLREAVSSLNRFLRASGVVLNVHVVVASLGVGQYRLMGAIAVPNGPRRYV